MSFDNLPEAKQERLETKFYFGRQFFRLCLDEKFDTETWELVELYCFCKSNPSISEMISSIDGVNIIVEAIERKNLAISYNMRKTIRDFEKIEVWWK